MLKFKKNKAPLTPDAQMELVDHLAELRSRLFRSALYVVVGMVITYRFFPEFLTLLKHPIQPYIDKKQIEVVFTNLPEAFLLRLQVSFLSGLAAASPFVIMELWGFVAPALTPQERKPVLFLAPFSILLFLAGTGTGYASLPMAYQWMFSYVGDIPDARLFQNAQQYILLTVKILLAFGVSYQLPIVLLFLARVGLINAGMMIKYWRHAVVGIAAAAAILTPSNDPLTMLMMAVPMAGLYGMSISLVRAFEPKPDGTRALSFVTMLFVALAPIGLLAAVGYWLWRAG
jgi:sec-independent protein translocase protein TatC